MKKFIFGALALSLMVSVISCRENTSESTEETVEDAAVNQETPSEMTSEAEMSEETDTATAVVDSIQAPEQQDQIEE
ncbi:hypothetical protein C7S20_04685 [Christiangramia fulva]|uniref:Uncharacterized protein n=1 Tax=Christiangramia fulva TaxID=2126553 RepID=A0A2R3Z2Y4_9FLAO|nr:hypothetical protein [Christiangramia fulva]AVR44616.1 hypothetical protein C7S20_04685 [Christiangramia fulva]